MSTPARKRLMRDFKMLEQDPPAGINGSPQDNNIMLWNAFIFGPDDSPWDGGKVMLLRSVSWDQSLICLDILQNQWTPVYDCAAILISIQSFKCDSLLWYPQSLLCDPNTNSYVNSEAALMYSENKREYNRRVRDAVEQSWTNDL
ncbi:hypothetical protein YC2023_097052 [Brassica napus]